MSQFVAMVASTMLVLVGCGPKPGVSVAPSSVNVASWQAMAVSASTNPTSDAIDASAFTDIRPTGAIGSNACVDCHQEQHKSYLQTSHSRSARRITAGSNNKPSAEFEYEKAGRLYEVRVSEEAMIHAEHIRGNQPDIIATNTAKMSLEVGSGANAHSYLFERDGFLVQSPLTWYTSAGQWGLSPGYAPAIQATFDRNVTTTCVFCHVGSIRTQGNHMERFAIEELTIGCERCHGVGGNHVNFHSPTTSQKKDSLVDDIVNPSRLSRTLGEAICSQCHLQGLVASTSPGVSRWDFRPGEPLHEIVTEYQLSDGPAEFKIVGHVEQLHGSECYQNTETLTCITCHDPHSHAKPESSSLRQRDHCVKCHVESKECLIPLSTRVSTQEDNCVKCHMPRRDTNVPHAALHDHRIAVHIESYRLASLPVPEKPSANEAPSRKPIELVPILDDKQLPNWQQQRRRALAFHSLAFGDQLPSELERDFVLAKSTLIELYRSGHHDPNLQVSLAKDYLAANQIQTARELAKNALAVSVAGDVGYVGAVDVLAQLALLDQDNQSALQWYRELTKYRWVSGDHVMLALCENNAGNRAAAISAIDTALRIDPTLLFAHELMVTILEADGQRDRAAAHADAITAIRAAGNKLPSQPR